MVSRGFSAVEIAAGVAVIGSILAVAIPTFIRNVHASHLVEATQGVSDIQRGAVAHAREQRALPGSAPLTPASVARGTKAVDPPGAWDHPAWVALRFRPVPEGAAHSFSFATDSQPSVLIARAHGDLDGDGVLSTFEGRVTLAEPGAEAKIEPGLIVESELE